jgi:hypothetical protein
MAAEKKLPIQFRLRRIETLQFELIQAPQPESKLKYSASFEFGMFPDEQTILCKLAFRLKEDSKDLLIIDTAVSFRISQDDFDTKIIKKNKYVIPKATARHLATIVTGTARGILHTKTEGTNFNKYPIPMLNVEERITEDVIIDF